MAALRLINLNFKYLAVYAFGIITIVALMTTRPIPIGSITLMELYVYILIAFYFVNLVLIQFGKPAETVAYWITLLLFSIIFFVDFGAFSTHQ